MPGSGEAASYGDLLITSLLVLAGVCIAAFVAVRVLGRFLATGSRRGAHLLDVVARVPLEPRRSLYVVDVAGKTLLVGTSEMGLSVLTELDRDAVQTRVVERPTFAELVRTAWTKRRSAKSTSVDPATETDVAAAAVPATTTARVGASAPVAVSRTVAATATDAATVPATTTARVGASAPVAVSRTVAATATDAGTDTATVTDAATAMATDATMAMATDAATATVMDAATVPDAADAATATAAATATVAATATDKSKVAASSPSKAATRGDSE